jgi:molybdopterin/thiamine biosynthesis adenylyltransferase/rhodanese-related sulfurtransferase/molybdopterin converting factor small subunit
MSNVTIRIPMPLRPYTAGAGDVEVNASTVREALHALVARHGEISPRVLSPDGELRQFVNIFLRGENVRELQALDTPVKDGDVISIIPAVAGGKAKDARIAELKKNIAEIEPSEAARLQAKGAALVDVREADEVVQGSPPGAVRISRGFLELKIEDVVPDLKRQVLVMCAGGTRSLFAAEDLRKLGYGNVVSVAGGFSRWKNQGLPVEVPQSLDASSRERYSRHLMMPEVGEAGQLKLLESKVLLIGAGGLGSPAAFYLAAAGVGTLGILDHDVVDRSNLQRQILHTDSRVGESKVASAKQTLQALNPALNIVAHDTHLDSRNVESIFKAYDLVVDGSDNFPTRYLVNDACVKLNLPNVHGAVYRFEGQATVFWPQYAKRRGPCYRCLYPEPPPAEFAPNCAEAGVLGVLPGVIGLLQAVEAIKLLLDIGDPLVGRLVYYDALAARFDELKLEPNRECRYCGEGSEFPGYVDYERFCAAA